MKKKMLLLVVILLTLSGCTKYISDDNKKRVVYEVTGQSLPSNILTFPVTTSDIKLFLASSSFNINCSFLLLMGSNWEVL